ncbi:hypothetical protein GCM10010112_86950 [Actinoplanes lobatus]|uniref:Uncharacterized protein n=1 Tax=Actinoplanes lobatus TaxID=113568 RepID=A0ABQ4AW20_9ACTN|nr:hypothetical protein GCM10010112_86950 [Actinoplanes lobatus]GIE45159.1 hypothetical protein Alo02nite_80570 [Actinoplanes lobatus]
MSRRRVRTSCDHAPPAIYRGEVVMDWSTHRSAPRPGPCRVCGRPTTLVDCAGTLCHKVCAEREATREIAAPAAGRRAGVRRGHLSLVGGR